MLKLVKHFIFSYIIDKCIILGPMMPLPPTLRYIYLLEDYISTFPYLMLKLFKDIHDLAMLKLFKRRGSWGT